MVKEGPVVYTDGARVGDERGDSVYHGVVIPDDALDRLGWEVGDWLFLRLQVEQLSGEDVPRLWITRLPDEFSSDHENAYKLRVDDGLNFVRFPREWSDSGGGRSFGVETGDRLALELKELSGGEMSLFVYQREDFSMRNIALTADNRQPLFKSLLAGLGLSMDEVPDVSGESPGRLFQVIPFEYRHPEFAPENSDGEYSRPPRIMPEREIEKFDVPVSRALNIDIEVSSNLYRHWMRKEDLDTERVYSEGYTDGFYVILPEKPTLFFTSTTTYGKETIPALSASDNPGEIRYGGNYVVKEDDFVKVYVPCKTSRADTSKPEVLDNGRDESDGWSDGLDGLE